MEYFQSYYQNTLLQYEIDNLLLFQASHTLNRPTEVKMAGNNPLQLIQQKGYLDLFIQDAYYKNIIGNRTEVLCRLVENWPEYDDLLIIVIGSSPLDNFPTTGAYVGNFNQNNLPRSVETLRNIRDNVFGDLDSVDYNSYHAKEDHGILFINVVPTEPVIPGTRESPGEYYLETAKFMIGFINRILNSKSGKKLAILDMRLRVHSHINELTLDEPKYGRNEDEYKLIPQESQYLIRFSHPAYFNENQKQNAIDQFNNLKYEFPGIACIYAEQNDCKIFIFKSVLVFDYHFLSF